MDPDAAGGFLDSGADFHEVETDRLHLGVFKFGVFENLVTEE